MRLVLVTHRLGGGGMTRQLAELASYWAEHGYDVTVITLAEPSTRDYGLHPGVRRIDLRTKKGGTLGNAARSVRALRKALKRIVPDIAIAMNLSVNAYLVLAGAGLDIRLIGEEPMAFSLGGQPLAFRILRGVLYRRLDAFVVQTERTRAAAEGSFGISPTHVVPNHLSPQFADDGDTNKSVWRSWPNHVPAVKLVAVGRLERQKGFDILIDALAMLTTDRSWGLVVLGDGSREAELRDQLERHGLRDRVMFAGWSDDPASTLRDSDVFVSSSRREGMSFALLEAMACGIAVIASDCPTGPRELITDGVDGILVPSEDAGALARALQRAIAEPALRRQLATAATGVRDRHRIDEVARLWEEIFSALRRQAPGLD